MVTPPAAAMEVCPAPVCTTGISVPIEGDRGVRRHRQSVGRGVVHLDSAVHLGQFHGSSIRASRFRLKPDSLSAGDSPRPHRSMPAMKRRTRSGSTGFHHTPSCFSALATITASTTPRMALTFSGVTPLPTSEGSVVAPAMVRM